MSSNGQNPKFGIFCAVAAQVLWGCFPIYIYAIKDVVPPFDFVAHRTIWSFFFLIQLVWVSRWMHHPVIPSRTEVKSSLTNRKTIGLHALAASLILCNWVGFVWAAMNDHVLDASLAYYICPLVVVLLGVLVLHERLTPLKWIAVLLAAIGVGYTAMSEDSASWIALMIAFSFGLYGLVKKKASMSALGGLTLETGFLTIPALFFLGWSWSNSPDSIWEMPWWVYALVLGSGIVTIAPLAFYASAVKHLPLSTVGFLQYIGPTLQFATGYFLLGENLDTTRLTGFFIVWSGVLCFLVAMWKSSQPPSGR